MQGGKGVGFVFAAPIAAVSLVAGVLCFPTFYSSVIVLTGVCVMAILWLNIRPSYVGIIIICFFGGMLRVHAGDVKLLKDNNPFVHIRFYFDQQLSRELQEPQRTLISGVLFGGSAGFTAEWKNIFRATGTSHIVAVSGANLVFVIQWLEVVLDTCRFHRRLRVGANYMVLAMYVLLTGATASVVRAALMVALTQFASIAGRRAYPLHMLAASVIVMVLIAPSVAGDIGFQFSCLATLGLIMAAPAVNGIAQQIGATVAATIFVLPLQLFYFHTLSFSALLANLCIAPIIPVLMVVGFIHLLCTSIISALGFITAWPLHISASVMLHILRWFAGLPGSSGEVFVSGPWVAALYGVAVAYCYKCCRLLCRF